MAASKTAVHTEPDPETTDLEAVEAPVQSGPVFERVPVPVVSYGLNPYTDMVRSLATAASVDPGKSEAVQFKHTVTDTGVRSNFDKIKRELQAAGTIVDVTVRSHIYDADSGRKFILPSEKGAALRLTGDGNVPVDKVKTFRVVFWVTDKIIRGEAAMDDEDDTEE